ncbi:Dipeptidyl aminopeptidase/acylaminoacyl peptidase [Flavobacterium sp. CF108]|uniref:S9 family peptidase n=1 Tax=unclassified Flavobacterium TaxID=196869 RepID=UPI0008C3595D|nr:MULTISPECIES: S9 family peptidase [unclassified Flavobacterium]SEO21592.1 Dipeptidyl aminopeptidase/acylaminoacyl peptidase [Flavobacterium sp. fv08]SHG51465.1 Dipeptidyl aminopeptidase/acylaminoacyl peptidase [Flavobacterium sp. CF108]
MGTTSKKISVFLTLLWCLITQAQGTLKEYKRANAVDSLFKNKVINTPKEFHWIGNEYVWYSNNLLKGKEFLLVDTKQQKQIQAFDHNKMGQSLSKILGKEVKSNDLPIENLEFDKSLSTLVFTTDTIKASCYLKTYEIVKTGAYKKLSKTDDYWGGNFDELGNKPVGSPDSLNIAFIKNYNLYIKNKKTKVETQLSYDGSKGFYYSSYLQWSPNSKEIVAYKVRPGEDHKIYFVESSPSDQFQPKLQTRDYLKPGDQLPFKSPQLFVVDSKKQIPVATDLFQQQYELSGIEWKDDSSAFTFEYNQRGHQVYRVLEVNATTGKVRVIIEETSSTFVDYSGKRYRYDLKKSNEIIWASERDGWNHLYLYDALSGKVKNQITKGNWPIREVLKVDEEKKQIYFTASGLDSNQDPYLLQFCRIDFNGKNFTRLTTENGNHKVTFSPDYKYYVDQYSRVDAAPITVLKSIDSQKTIVELQKADISALQKTGWIAPEVFTAKARDGKTDIWGVIVRPTTFDPNRKYPIIEYIYAGPQDSFVPKNFQPYYWAMSSLAELGFIVVQIDGMGTSNRSKAFHDVCWKNLKDSGFADRKLWMKAAAAKYSYMNIDKVGIHGTSAGGQNAGAALVFNSDFYDVAVASCGCHDNRMDKMWWNEQWMGYPIGPEYGACSNTANAAQLNGNLMLIVGELDDNVDPASTMQFANALIKANKNFELVTVPGMGHSAGGDFGERKRRDYFVQHLLGVIPPTWEEIYK